MKETISGGQHSPIPITRQGTKVMKYFGILFIFLFSTNCYAQKFDGLALTPPMGWNTYNTFAGKFDEKIIRDMADLIVSTGMKDAAISISSSTTIGLAHATVSVF